MTMPDFTLSRDAFGRLSLITGAGVVLENVVPVRAFPIGAPDVGIALVSPDGHEAAWLESLTDLLTGLSRLIQEGGFTAGQKESGGQMINRLVLNLSLIHI